MKKEKICGIYCIENLINGKKYIGQSINIYSRWKQHLSKLRKNKHENEKLQNAWNKYHEDNFRFYIIVEVDIKQLDEFEIYYIALNDSYKHGYNKDTGGSDNKVMPIEARKKLSEFRKNLSEEEREKLRLSQESRPIYQIDLNGAVIKEWYGAREASKKMQINQSALWQCLHHERLTLYGYIWLFVDEFDAFDLSKYINKSTQSRMIAQKSKSGEIVKIWSSASSAKICGFDSSCIIKCCKGKRQQYKGFLWSYYKNAS